MQMQKGQTPHAESVLFDGNRESYLVAVPIAGCASVAVISVGIAIGSAVSVAIIRVSKSEAKA